MWISTTNDPPMGEGIEAYYFIDKPTDDSLSAMWSNYTNCERLIQCGSYETQIRYLLKCDAVDCCKEEETGNQVEFQIPNVHPAILAENFTHTPNVTVQTEFGEVTCDVWSWQFTAEHWRVCTTVDKTQPTQVALHQWFVQAFEERVAIDFKDFKGIPETSRQDFYQSFALPQQCKGNILHCDDYRKQGLLKARPPTAAERIQKWREEVYKKNGKVAPPLRQF